MILLKKLEKIEPKKFYLLFLAFLIKMLKTFLIGLLSFPKEILLKHIWYFGVLKNLFLAVLQTGTCLLLCISLLSYSNVSSFGKNLLYRKKQKEAGKQQTAQNSIVFLH